MWRKKPSDKRMAKKISSWKQKSKYHVVAPDNFENHTLGETISKDSKQLVGRTVDVSLRDLIGDKSKQHLKLVFEIISVDGFKAKTQFKAFTANPGYLRSKVRKGSSKIDCIKSINIADGKKAQIKVMAVTHSNVQTSRGKDMMLKINEILEKYENSKVEDFVQASLFGKLGTEIYREIKRIAPVRRVEIEQVKII